MTLRYLMPPVRPMHNPVLTLGLLKSVGVFSRLVLRYDEHVSCIGLEIHERNMRN